MKIIGRDVGKSRSNIPGLRPVSANALHRLLALLSAFTYSSHREAFTRSDLIKVLPKPPSKQNTVYVQGLLDLLAELCPHKSGEAYAICLQVIPPSEHRTAGKSVLTIAGLNGVPPYVSGHLKDLCGFMQRVATVKEGTETETKAEILRRIRQEMTLEQVDYSYAKFYHLLSKVQHRQKKLEQYLEKLDRQVFYAQDKLVLAQIGRMITSLHDLIEFCVSPEEGGIDLEKQGEVLLEKMNRVACSVKPFKDDDDSAQILYDCTVKASVPDYTECLYYLDRCNNCAHLICKLVHNGFFARNFPDKIEVATVARMATTVSFSRSKETWSDVLFEFMKEHDLTGLTGVSELVEAAQDHYPGESTTILPVHPEIQLVTHFNYPKPVNPPIKCIGASKGLSATTALFLDRWRKASPSGSNSKYYSGSSTNGHLGFPWGFPICRGMSKVRGKIYQDLAKIFVEALVKEGYAKRGASGIDKGGREANGDGCKAEKCLGWLCSDPRCPVALMYEEDDEEERELAEMIKDNVESKPDQDKTNIDGKKRKKRCKGNCPLWKCPDIFNSSAEVVIDSNSESSSSSDGKGSENGHDQGWGPGALGMREDWPLGVVYNV